MLKESEINRNTSPPYSELTIRNFECYQNSVVYMPYKCSNCNINLIMKTDSLYCTSCNYKQKDISLLPSESYIKQQINKILEKKYITNSKIK